MSIKAYFIDIDGTLLSGHKDKNINLNDKLAIKNALKKNIFVILSTGRSLPEAKEVWNQFKIDNKYSSYVIVNNGSAIWDLRKNELLFNEYIDEKTYRDLIKFCFEKKWAIKNSFEKIFWTKNIFYKIIFSFTKKISTSNEYEKAIYSSESSRKLGVLTKGTKRSVKKCSEIIKNKFPEVDVTISGPGLYIEINKKGINKGQALKFLSNKLNIDLKDTVHIGDSLNDESAFKISGKSVFMKNGMKELKKISTHQTLTQKKSGVANAINSFESIEKK